MPPLTVIAVKRTKLGIRGGGPIGYVVDEDYSPNGIDDIRAALGRNFNGAIESCHIRGTLDAVGIADVRELRLQNGELLVLVDSPMFRRYGYASAETFYVRHTQGNQ